MYDKEYYQAHKDQFREYQSGTTKRTARRERNTTESTERPIATD